MGTPRFLPSFSRVRAAVIGNRWASIAALVVVVIGAGGAALIGLQPVISGLLIAVIISASLALLAWRSRGRSDPAPQGAPSVFAMFALVGIVTLGLIQLIPYGRAHSNPPVTGEPAWATPETRELMVRACFGCHSNEVEWPWYSNVAPISWAVTDHVDEGRDEVNYSEFGNGGGDFDDTLESILDGEMPPGYFTVFGLHPEAKLTDAERDQLIAGLRATPGLSEGGD